MKKKYSNPGLITFPLVEAGNVPLSNLAAVLYSIYGNLCVITGNDGKILFKRNDDKIRVFSVKYKVTRNWITRIANYSLAQMHITVIILKLRKEVDAWILFIGGEGLLLPIITAKILQKDVIIVSAGSGTKDNKVFKDPLANILHIMYNVDYHLSTRILFYSKRLIEKTTLNKFQSKIKIAHEHYINFNKFHTQIPLKSRDNLVGYIGRFGTEKGTLNFVNALPIVLKENCGVHFIIGGNGPLKNDLERYINEHAHD